MIQKVFSITLIISHFVICTDDAGESDDTRKEPQTAKDEKDGADSETESPNEIESSKDCQPDAVDLPVSLKT